MEPRALRRGGAGIRRISVHTLRHSAGTMALEAGLDERAIMELLGHRSADIARLYQQWRSQMRERTADALERFHNASGDL